ncbi:nucleotide-diphospho-sugar transferase [Aspergillus saccharolyticus JOP 1030-1]|uniref:Nucleotide-diphospho-sugar transferase n=1 Tax=Aspergillus saccharolyticus JOP 1030-1 TaxID=1450539 RepID=A0A319AIL9_9EURO|nr:nucleotide-diphospho-sugar transferase [Aspergillus saccharolyticus JOP 1030-1]PYH46492.1 nucleotide-diphospho-sugar transferase [Aspergillus saccharolyticus JOP 1030-1]
MADHPPKVWASLITNLNYLPGLLTLAHSLQQTKTAYPFVALYTTSFPAEGIAALRAREIPARLVPTVIPAAPCTYTHDPRFEEAWKKLVVFSLYEYDRVVLLDSDMLVRQNMDELMEVALDGERQVFAASHACACNPAKKPHYPREWAPSNCAFTPQHPDPDRAQHTGAAATAGVAMLNSGLLVVQPRETDFVAVQTALQDGERVRSYALADQEFLSVVFRGRWRPLPYVYNALKPMRGPQGTHGPLWRDEAVKNVHYIWAVKPWQLSQREREESQDAPTHWWWAANEARWCGEEARGVRDGW